MNQNSNFLLEIETNLTLSLNQWARLNRYQRYAVDKKNIEKFSKLLLPYMRKRIAHFNVVLDANPASDIDNAILTVKFFVDALRKQKIVEDDTKSYFKNLQINFDKSIKKGFGLIKVYGEWRNV